MKKKCADCQIIKDYTEFTIKKSGRPYSYCKECFNEYKKKWNEDNKEILAETQREYQRNNREKINEYYRKRYAENKEEYSIRNKERYQKRIKQNEDKTNA